MFHQRRRQAIDELGLAIACIGFVREVGHFRRIRREIEELGFARRVACEATFLGAARRQLVESGSLQLVYDPRDQSCQIGLRLLGGGDDLVDVRHLQGIGKALIGDDAEAEHAHAHVTRDEHLRHG